MYSFPWRSHKPVFECFTLRCFWWGWTRSLCIVMLLLFLHIMGTFQEVTSGLAILYIILYYIIASPIDNCNCWLPPQIYWVLVSSEHHRNHPASVCWPFCFEDQRKGPWYREHKIETALLWMCAGEVCLRLNTVYIFWLKWFLTV